MIVLRISLIVLLLAVNTSAQWTMSGGSNYVPPPPPPPPGSEPWRGILNYSRATDWSHAGVNIAGVPGIPTYTNDCGTVAPSGVREWQASHQYNVGDKVSDTRGNLQVVTTAGTSGTTEPSNNGSVPPDSWQINSAIPTTDGSVVWQVYPDGSNGGTDTINITNAIVDCNGRHGVVHLTAGHFYITAGIVFNGGFRYPQTWLGSPTAIPRYYIPVSYVLLKGVGPMQTFLHFPRKGCGAIDICVQASTASFNNYAPGGSYPVAVNPGGAAQWLGSGTSTGSYAKGDTTLIVGPWTGNAPDIGDVVFLDQNNDAVSICPATPPATPYNCTMAGASQIGPTPTTATIVTSMPHGYHVGQCVGIGDVPSKSYNTGVNGVGYNSGMNPVKPTPGAGSSSASVACQGPPYLPTFWQITDVGCIVNSAFVTQANCGANPIVAFQYDAGVSGLAPSGSGQATTDTGGMWLTTVGGATMNAGSDPTQSARQCSNVANPNVSPGINTPNPSCRPGEYSIRSQFEIKTITDKVAGGTGSCTAPAGGWCYTIDPGLYMPNWHESQRPGVWWTGPKDVGDGLEGFTYFTEHNPSDGTQFGIQFTNAANGWVRNARALDINRSFVAAVLSTHITAMDNYIGGTRGGAATAYVFEDNAAADTLIMNNICQHVVSCLMTSTVMGRVGAYNFMIDASYMAGSYSCVNCLMPLMTMLHLAASYNLFEGNDSAGIQTDNQHGTGGISTAFRSRTRAQDLPNKATNRNGTSNASNNRGLNFIGMVMGWAGLSNRYLDDNIANSAGATDNTIFQLGKWRQNTGANWVDQLSTPSTVRWGNYDAATQTTRWCGDALTCSCGAMAVGQYCRLENETATAGYTFLPSNAVPANHNLPASFFLTGPPAFWTTTWGTPGWPAMGPDVDATGSPFDTDCPSGIVTNGGQSSIGTGPGSFSRCDGIGMGHRAYQIPAQICYNNLPVDTEYTRVWNNGETWGQRTFHVTDATWTANGGVGSRAYVTLTAANDIIMNASYPYTVQVSGIDPPGYNGTFQLPGKDVRNQDTSTTITYWLASNPGLFNAAGSAAATVTTPNYKQFDARWCYPNEFPGETAPTPMPAVK